MKIKYAVAIIALCALFDGCSEETGNSERAKKDTVIINTANINNHEKRKEVQDKLNQHAQCIKSRNVDILKDSIRFAAVFDSCWSLYMPTNKVESRDSL